MSWQNQATRFALLIALYVGVVLVLFSPFFEFWKELIGSLVVRLKNGTTFEVGTGLSDADRDNPPPIGSEIKFKYQELTDGGVPRFPSFLGMSDK